MSKKKFIKQEFNDGSRTFTSCHFIGKKNEKEDDQKTFSFFPSPNFSLLNNRKQIGGKERGENRGVKVSPIIRKHKMGSMSSFGESMMEDGSNVSQMKSSSFEIMDATEEEEEDYHPQKLQESKFFKKNNTTPSSSSSSSLTTFRADKKTLLKNHASPPSPPVYFNKGISKKGIFKSKISRNSREALDIKKKSIKKKIEKKKKKKKDTRNLNDQLRWPDFIKCGNNVIPNHAEPQTISRNVSMVCTFTDFLHERLFDVIEKYGKNRIILGCVPWFTNIDIVRALTKADQVAFVVNDEAYSKWGYGTVKKEKFDILPRFRVPFNQIWEGKIETPLNFLKNTYEPVRCFGNSSNKGGMSSILHAKFMIICDDNNMPKWVWDGSMNFTQNSQNNFEMAHFIEDTKTAFHLFFKFGNIFLSSRSLNYNDE